MSSFLAQFDNVSFAGSLLLWYTILLPLLSYYLHKYLTHINDPFIQRRLPQLALLSNYFLLILLFIIAPLQWAEIIYLEHYELGIGRLREYLFFTRVIWEQLSMWIRLVRYWYLWYKHQYQKHYALSVYIKAININEVNSNFFIKYRHTLGNFRFLFTTICIVWCLQIVGFAVIILVLNDQTLAFNLCTCVGFAFYLFQCLLFVSLAITMSKIRDTLSIRSEVFYESIAASLCCFILLLVLILSNVNVFGMQLMSNKYFISSVLFIFPDFVIYPFMILMTSCWVYLKMKHNQNVHQLKQQQAEMERCAEHPPKTALHGNLQSLSMTFDTTNVPQLGGLKYTVSRETISICEESANTHNFPSFSPHFNEHNESMTFVDDKIDPRLKSMHSSGEASSASPLHSKKSYLLNGFLPHKEGFELFAEHLINEYAIENLLFLIEVEQFKQNCHQIYDSDLWLEPRELPKSLPTSIGLQAFDKNLKLQFCMLYHKYIDNVNAEFSVNVASRNRSICQSIYNEYYELAHGLNVSDEEYDSSDFDEEDDPSRISMHLSPKIRSPRSPKLRFSAKYDLTCTQSLDHEHTVALSTKPKPQTNRPAHSNNIIGFRSKETANLATDDPADHELKQLKEATPDAPDEQDHEMPAVTDTEASATKTISILPPMKSLGAKMNAHCNDSNKLSVAAYTKLAPKKRSSSTSAMNSNEQSVETRSMGADQLTIYEAQCDALTDQEETPAPPVFLTPMVTPLPDQEASQTNMHYTLKCGKITISLPTASAATSPLPATPAGGELSALPDNNEEAEPSKSPSSAAREDKSKRVFPDSPTKKLRVKTLLSMENTLRQSTPSPYEEPSVASKSFAMSTSTTNSTATTVSHGSDEQSVKTVASNSFSVGSANNSNSKTKGKRMSMSNTWSMDACNMHPKPSMHLQHSTCSNDSIAETDENERKIGRRRQSRNGKIEKHRKRSSITLRMALQKSGSGSLMSLRSNKVARNEMNQRVQQMMFLMSDTQRNSSSARAILDKYTNDLEDTQAMIDAVDHCLKDVMANLRDSFGRFVFTDAYKRWSGED
eukprot:CAMPEP_0197027824 /NCGR_PEP_ID=MMETSP1384-20130603/7696_1 /TAXON_ID=29189 /ORGANISM="Ammonia sp." /LENGTH=1059 /DNA_ID=CAMNT_0042456737 /DNA_START=14 /DNA_END=3196 /DNA_ORIENTATION=-